MANHRWELFRLLFRCLRSARIVRHPVAYRVTSSRAVAASDGARKTPRRTKVTENPRKDFFFPSGPEEILFPRVSISSTIEAEWRSRMSNQKSARSRDGRDGSGKFKYREYSLNISVESRNTFRLPNRISMALFVRSVGQYRRPPLVGNARARAVESLTGVGAPICVRVR